jgi:hypothetical protein
MKWQVMLVVGLGCVLATQLAAQPNQKDASQPAAKQDAADEKNIRALIVELGDNSFNKREAAQKRLFEIGRPALELLKKAAKENTDLEVRERATELVRKLEAKTKKFSYVDLQSKANQKLTDTFGSSPEGNNLASLAKGEQVLEDVKFKVADGFIQLGSKLLKEAKPDQVDGIKVGKACAKLHILHATQYGSGLGVIADNTEIAKYVVHYEGGASETIPVVYGKDVRNWWFSANEGGVTRGKVAWRGDNEATKQTGGRRQIRLYLGTWENPHPAKKVTSIDYVKVGETPAAPFCVAMTLEEK